MQRDASTARVASAKGDAVNGQDASQTLQARADALCQTLASQPTQERIDEGVLALKLLREAREFTRLCELGEWVCRYRVDDACSASFYAQGLIECGRLAVAVAFLEEAKRRCVAGNALLNPEEAEVRRAAHNALLDEFDGLLDRMRRR